MNSTRAPHFAKRRIRSISCALTTLTFLFCDAAYSATPEDYLEELKQILPRSAEWEDWLEKSGELPPDFEGMTSMPDIPDPLTQGPHGEIRTAQEWDAQAEALKDLFHRWVIGSVPPAPANLKATLLAERIEESSTIREVELSFGPDEKAHLWMEVMIPQGEGPFPVFITQHNHRAWALIALRRGYIACTYAGADSRDDTDSFVEAYPDHDWSKLTRRAWAASRVIDYLVQSPKVNADQIALTGHSRNGKLSLIASALDPRITCVISSSSGAGGAMATRYFGESQFGEGIENITRVFPDWFHPRLRFFVGREDKLPVDLHQLVALNAPRACLLSIALNDGVESTWAMQHTYNSAKSVYELYDATDRLRILWRPGGHETWTAIIERYMDWCDVQFGRGDYTFPERYIHPHDWQAWASASSPKPKRDPLPSRTRAQPDALRHAVQSLLGDAPPQANGPRGTYGKHKSHEAELLRRRGAGAGVEKESLVFGEYINADIYSKIGYSDSGKQYPAVLWLPTACPSTGYTPAYRRGSPAQTTFAQNGYVTFAFDPIGYGRRIEEVEGFYTRYPNWSLLGKMVRDAEAAFETMRSTPYIDPDRIFVVGYSEGAFVAEHFAAVEDRIAGYALISPPPLFASSYPAAKTRWSHTTMLLPQLGRYLDSQPPYDLSNLLHAIAPKPLLLVTPKLDRESPPELLDPIIQTLKEAYGNEAREHRFIHAVPTTYGHFDPSLQKRVMQWLATQE